MRKRTWPDILAEPACVAAEVEAKPMSAANKAEDGSWPGRRPGSVRASIVDAEVSKIMTVMVRNKRRHPGGLHPNTRSIF